MKDVERLLAEAALEAPRAELDRRMDRLFSAAPVRRGSWVSRPVPLWFVASSLVLVAVGGFLWGDRRARDAAPQQASVPAVFIFQGDAGLGNAFNRVGGTRSFLTSPNSVRVYVETPVDAGNNPI